MGLIIVGLLLVIAGFIVNVLDVLPGTVMRAVGWILIAVGAVLLFLDLLRDAARSRPLAGGADEPQLTFIVWGIGLIILGLLLDVFTSLGGGLLRTVGLVLIVAGIVIALIDIARQPRYRIAR
jgi:hypothetical protein